MDDRQFEELTLSGDTLECELSMEGVLERPQGLDI
jgi:hypothetical protein